MDGESWSLFNSPHRGQWVDTSPFLSLENKGPCGCVLFIFIRFVMVLQYVTNELHPILSSTFIKQTHPTCWQKVVHPLLHVVQRHVEPRRDNTALVDTSGELRTTNVTKNTPKERHDDTANEEKQQQSSPKVGGDVLGLNFDNYNDSV